MPSLSDLSSELLLNIVRFVDIDDIEAFYATCKGFKAFSEQCLDTHLDRKGLLTSVTIGLNDSRPDGEWPWPDAEEQRILDGLTSVDVGIDEVPQNVWNLPNLIAALSSEEDCQLYPRLLCLKFDFLHYHQNLHGRPLSLRDIHPGNCKLGIDVATFLTAALNNGNSDDMETSTLSALRSNPDDARLLFLFTMLPRLHTVRFNGRWFEAVEGVILDRFSVDYLLGPNGRLHGTFLQSLVNVELHNLHDSYGLSSKFIGGLINLPSVRRVRGFHVSAESTEWLHTRAKSYLTHLEMSRSAITTDIFTFYFKAIRSLKTFVSRSVRRLSGWDPRGIVQALILYAGHSLTYLELTHSATHLYYCEVQQSMVGHLTALKVLQQVRLETISLCKAVAKEQKGTEAPSRIIADPTRIVIGKRIDNMSGEISNSDAIRPSTATPQISKNTSFVFQHLTDIMPASIKKISLTGPISRAEARTFTTGLGELKAVRQPELERLELEHGSMDSKTRKLCRDAGVDVKARSAVKKRNDRSATSTLKRLTELQQGHSWFS